MRMRISQIEGLIEEHVKKEKEKRNQRYIN